MYTALHQARHAAIYLTESFVLCLYSTLQHCSILCLCLAGLLYFFALMKLCSYSYLMLCFCHYCRQLTSWRWTSLYKTTQAQQLKILTLFLFSWPRIFDVWKSCFVRRDYYCWDDTGWSLHIRLLWCGVLLWLGSGGCVLVVVGCGWRVGLFAWCVCRKRYPSYLPKT